MTDHLISAPGHPPGAPRAGYLKPFYIDGSLKFIDPNGQIYAVQLTPVSGPGAPSPSDFRAALQIDKPLSLNKGQMQMFYRDLLALSALSDRRGTYLGISNPGSDSIGYQTHGPHMHLMEALFNQFGVGGLSSTGFNFGQGGNGVDLSLTATLGSGATAVTANYQYLPNGAYFVVPDTGTVVEVPTNKNRTAGFRKYRCFYAKRTGGGTLTFSVTQAGAVVSSKVVDTSAGTPADHGLVAYVDIEYADGLRSTNIPTLTVTGSVATSHYLGSFLLLDTGNVLAVNLGYGGSSLELNTVAVRLNENLTTVLEALSVSYLCHAHKEEDTTGADISAWMDRMASEFPYYSHVFYGPSPQEDAANDAADAVIEGVMLPKCLAYNFAFLDQRRTLQSKELLEALDILGDGIHLGDPAKRIDGYTAVDELFKNLAPWHPSMEPVRRRDAAMDFLTRRTARIGGVQSTLTTATGGTSVNWTAEHGAGYNGFYANSGTGPAADTYAGCRAMSRCRWYGNYDFRFRFLLATTLAAGTHAGFAIGVTTDAVATLAEQGLWVQIHGGAAPFVRILLHDGTNLYTSPDFLLPSANSGVPANDVAKGFIPQSGDAPWHNFAVEYKSNGASTTKEVFVYMAPNRPYNAATRPFRPYLVAHWQQVVSNGSSSPASGTNQANFRVGAGATPTAASFPAAFFSGFEIDQSGDDLSNYGLFNGF